MAEENKTQKLNSNAVWKPLGASNHTAEDRQNEDYYATDPAAGEMLLEIEDIDKSKPIWECSSGENHLANVFIKNGYNVITSDIVKRLPNTIQMDFLSKENNKPFDGTIITNPPYSKAIEFVEKAMELVTEGNEVIMFLKVLFMEGKKRRELFKKYPPKRIWVSSSRIICAKNGDFQKMIDNGGSAIAYAWYVFEKGYKGDTTLKWFN